MHVSGPQEHESAVGGRLQAGRDVVHRGVGLLVGTEEVGKSHTIEKQTNNTIKKTVKTKYRRYLAWRVADIT